MMMADIVQALKTRARILQKESRNNDEAALARLKKHSNFKNLNSSEIVNLLKRRHCLSVVAIEAGFEGWSQAAQIFGGRNPGSFGTALYPKGCWAHSNIWSASYEEAKQIREEHGGFLLAYKNQFLIVEDEYIRTMGLDPDDPDFHLMGRDWISPKDWQARTRLYGKLISLTWA
jgi:hypothetical protein